MRKFGDQYMVPRLFGLSLAALLIAFGAISLFVADELPVTGALDIWICCLMAYMFFNGKTVEWPLFLFLLAYFAANCATAVFAGAPMYDFLQAYRWVIYLIVLALAAGRYLYGSMKALQFLAFSLVGLALINAVVTIAKRGYGSRPNLLLENNFELALFAGLIVVVFDSLSPFRRQLLVCAAGILTVLSGSRSGIVTFAVLWCFCVFRERVSNPFIKYMMVCSIPLAVVVASFVFEQRDTGNTIDRVNFLNVFLNDTASRGPFEWIVGEKPITPLSSGACESLSYYEKLFSSVGDGSCYSVILHSFVLRVLFDAGIFGLFISIWVPWYVMRKSGVSTLSTCTLLAIALANGISVSGINNPYVLLPTLLAVLVVGPANRMNDHHTQKGIAVSV